MLYRPLLIGTFNTVSFLKFEPFIFHQKGWYPLKPSIISFYFPTCNGLHRDIHLVFNSFHHSCCFKRPENTRGNTQILTPSFQVQIHKSCDFFLTQLFSSSPHGPMGPTTTNQATQDIAGGEVSTDTGREAVQFPRVLMTSTRRRPMGKVPAGKSPRGQLVVKIMGILVMYIYMIIYVYTIPKKPGSWRS